MAVEKNKVLFPPSYQRYLAFGYADSSLRIGSCDTERAVTVFEGKTYGEILCAACPNSKTIITGGTSTVSWIGYALKAVVQLWWSLFEELCECTRSSVVMLPTGKTFHTFWATNDMKSWMWKSKSINLPKFDISVLTRKCLSSCLKMWKARSKRRVLGEVTSNRSL